MAALRDFWQITKPGIVCGNLISLAGGFLLGSRGKVDFALFFSTAAGVSLLVAAASVCNNCIDRDLDRKMARTKQRAIACGRLPLFTALLFASVLGVLGLSLLAGAEIALAAACAGFSIYVGLYSPLKRRWLHAPLLGSLAGAAPPVAGYCAASHAFDPAAATLLAIFCLWQIPHFDAIAIYRLEDYRAAGVPTLPLAWGVAAAKKRIVVFIALFVAATFLLTVENFTGFGFLAVSAAAGGAWLWLAGQNADDPQWARRIFFASLWIPPLLSLMMALDFSPR